MYALQHDNDTSATATSLSSLGRTRANGGRVFSAPKLWRRMQS